MKTIIFLLVFRKKYLFFFFVFLFCFSFLQFRVLRFRVLRLCVLRFRVLRLCVCVVLISIRTKTKGCVAESKVVFNAVHSTPVHSTPTVSAGADDGFPNVVCE
jgi:hypothetical protein